MNASVGKYRRRNAHGLRYRCGLKGTGQSSLYDPNVLLGQAVTPATLFRLQAASEHEDCCPAQQGIDTSSASPWA